MVEQTGGGSPMDDCSGRRGFLGASVAGLISAAAAGRSVWGAEATRETFTYKTVGDCAIKADVIRPSSREPLPVAVWTHGGALIMGDRRGIDRTLRG